MSSDPLPVVYVETNWLVALVLPHDRGHRTACELLAAATNGECEVRIPASCFLEAHDRAKVEREKKPAELEDIKGLLDNAIANGFDDLAEAARGLGSKALLGYFRRDTSLLLNALEENPAIVKLHQPKREMELMGILRKQINFEAKHRFDLYVLASVVADREGTETSRPAVFCTMNTKDFEPSEKINARIRPELYKAYSLYWLGSFDWRTGVERWKYRMVADVLER